MNKKFNIHDWQAKQRQQRLKEDYRPSWRAYDVIDKSNNDEIVAKKLTYDRAIEISKTNPNWKIKATDRLAENEQKYYDLLNDLRDEGHLHRYGVTQLQMKFGLSEEEAQKIYNQYKEDLKAEQPDAYDFYMKDLNESLNPEVSQKVNSFIKAMAKRYDYSEQDAVFAIMAALKQRNMDEANVTGTGASFNAGSGEGYMTPKAFKKKNKK